MKEIDARGLSCPQPVVLTKKAIDENRPPELRVFVTGKAALENVTRLAASNGYSVESEHHGEDYTLVLRLDEYAAKTEASVSPPVICGGRSVLFITSNKFGEGSEELGGTLMQAFVNVLGEITPRPDSIIFANSGVFLTTEGSPVIETLRNLEKSGMEITSCGTCLQYFNLKDKLLAGKIGNMYAIAESLFRASHLVKL
ncbi:MAG: sulfurtransferase-like selenium metabolism protein YedF [Spirochaetes bacterium]|jgi:selenium metabolism protein YedF|nr:sulfurtransferase-like selenium metabolism protein YedF [Spirochaetota bacterium]